MQEAASPDSGSEPERGYFQSTYWTPSAQEGLDQNLLMAFDTAREKALKKVGPFMVPPTMSSAKTCNYKGLPVPLKANYSISSACATSAHCIGKWGRTNSNGKTGHCIFGEAKSWTGL